MLSILEERSPVRTSGFGASAHTGKRISVVLVDDDVHFRDAAQEELEGLGFEVQGFASGADLRASIAACRTAQIIVLEWFLRDGAGDALLLGLREEGVQLPIVILTERSLPYLEKRALECGAVDFVDKLRGIPILATRLRIIAAAGQIKQPLTQNNLHLRGLTLKLDTNRACWQDKDVNLTLTEFKIVSLLGSSSGTYSTYRQIYDCMHYEGFLAGVGGSFETNVRSAIKRIRHKFVDLDPTFNEIENYPGVGYRWRA